MGKKIGKQTIEYTNKPKIISNYSIVGKKEGNGNFKDYFDFVLQNDKFGEKTFEHSERKILQHAILSAINKAGLKVEDIDLLVAGDLLNQIISSAFTAREIQSSFLGLYGACSTMGEALGVGATFVDGGFYGKVACATGSHFSTVERQYRFPLELGNQRPPTSQWTVTGAGCSILSSKGTGPVVSKATFGKVIDFGVKDVNNMGSCMAPSAANSLVAFFEDTKSTPDEYDLIATGDLGKLGSEILLDLMEYQGYKLGANYCDCGQMIFNNDQKTFQGGSGAGCSAVIFNSYILSKLRSKEFKRILFAPTGALLSPLSSQQGDSIPGICHVILVENMEDD